MERNDMFTTYGSIENSYRSKYVEKIRLKVPKDEIWVGIEKINGANFSINYSDDGKHRYAKRSGYLKKNEYFYKYEDIMKKLESNFHNAYEYVKILYSNCKAVNFFGELFGFQKGTFYTDHTDFIGFDVRVDGSYVNFDQMIDIYEHSNILHVEPIISGTLDEILAFNVDTYESTISQKYSGQSGHYILNNIAEGIVVLPMHNNYLNSGSRCILKIKASAFSEKKNYITRHIGFNPKMTNKALEYLDILLTYNTRIRIDGMIGKIGPDTNSDKICGAVVQDILRDFMIDTEYDIKDLDGNQKKAVLKSLSYSIKKLF